MWKPHSLDCCILSHSSWHILSGCEQSCVCVLPVTGSRWLVLPRKHLHTHLHIHMIEFESKFRLTCNVSAMITGLLASQSSCQCSWVLMSVFPQDASTQWVFTVLFLKLPAHERVRLEQPSRGAFVNALARLGRRSHLKRQMAEMVDVVWHVLCSRRETERRGWDEVISQQVIDAFKQPEAAQLTTGTLLLLIRWGCG